jgi:hypothetical protein
MRAGESRPAVRPRADHAGHGVVWRFAPRLTALGLYGRPRSVAVHGLELSEGLPVPQEPAYADKRSHDGEAPSASE